MGILKSVVEFVEGVIDGAKKRTAPRFVEVPAERPTPRQIMAEQFEESAIDPEWPFEALEGPERIVRLMTAGDASPLVTGVGIVNEPDRTVTATRTRDRRPRVNRGRNGPSVDRLARANTHGQFNHLIERVQRGDLKITDALIEAGLEKPRTRVGNMYAEWIRSTHEERREFLAKVMDKQLFDKPGHSGWLLRNPGYSTVPDGLRGEPTEVKN
jgi:hypothetical protein